MPTYGRICHLDLICMLIFDSCETSNIETKKDKRTILRHVGSLKNIDNAGTFFTAEAIKFLLRV